MRSFCHKTTHLFYVCSLRAKLGHSVLKHELKALSFIFVVFCDDHLYFVMMGSGQGLDQGQVCVKKHEDLIPDVGVVGTEVTWKHPP